MIRCTHGSAFEVQVGRPGDDLRLAQDAQGRWLEAHPLEAVLSEVSPIYAALDGYRFTVCGECPSAPVECDLCGIVGGHALWCPDSPVECWKLPLSPAEQARRQQEARI